MDMEAVHLANRKEYLKNKKIPTDKTVGEVEGGYSYKMFNPYIIYHKCYVLSTKYLKIRTYKRNDIGMKNYTHVYLL